MISKNKKYSPSFGHDLISKSFEFLFQQLKYKLESLLAVYCVGRYQVDISSQCIPNAQTPRGSSTRTYSGQGVYWTGPKPQECPGEWCWLWRAAGLLFHKSPADTCVLGSHRATFCLQPPLPPASALGKQPSPFHPSSTTVTAGLVWDCEPPVEQRCGRVSPALTWPTGSPGSPGERGGTVGGRVCVCVILSHRRSWGKLCRNGLTYMRRHSRLRFLAFQPVENFYLKHTDLRPSPHPHTPVSWLSF